jgi:hypothetical protein
LKEEEIQRSQSKNKVSLEVKEETFKIEEEIRQLEIIKDVRDELNMIRVVLEDQDKATSDARRLFGERRGWLVENLIRQKREINQLDERAEKVYIAVSSPKIMPSTAHLFSPQLKDLLDLKQKQANVVEARSQRHQAQESAKLAKETTKQGRAILLFTMITIIFVREPIYHLCLI